MALLDEDLTWTIAAGAVAVVLCAGAAVRVRVGAGATPPRRKVQRAAVPPAPTSVVGVP
jgi:hypothetical protein